MSCFDGFPFPPLESIEMFRKASEVVDRVRAGSPQLDQPQRSREGAALNELERALRVILAQAHEDVVIEHAERALRRARDIMTA